MAAITDSVSQSFDLDAILKEFNVDNAVPPSVPKEDDSAVARVRESLGLGRSLLRKKQSTVEKSEVPSDNDIAAGTDQNEDGLLLEKATKPRKRIIDSDDEDIVVSVPVHRSSSVVSAAPDASDNETASDRDHDTPGSSISDDDDLPSTEEIMADIRKARLEALSAKVAAKNPVPTEDSETVMSDRSSSASHSPSASPRSERRQKVRKASKKAIEEMHRETQRMARNMALRPEVKITKKIDMNSIFDKFGFNPQGNQKEETKPEEDQDSVPAEIVDENPTETTSAPSVQVPKPEPLLPLRERTPDLDDYDSDESLPSPSKILSSMPKNPTNQPTPRKVQFTLPPSNSSDTDSDSDVEILPPPQAKSHLTTTPDRTRKRTALIRALANVKSPNQRSPGHLTQRELDLMLSREAAVQAAQKREERRAELKSLGIDIEKVIEKRDLLEEAREEARRVRLEEGGDESDEEYVDEEEGVEGDVDESDSGEDSEEDESEKGDDDGDDDEEMEDDESDEEMQDAVDEDEPRKRKGRKLQITSDDEEEVSGSPAVIPESTMGTQPQPPQAISALQAKDDLSLSQFFTETQLSGVTQKPASHNALQFQSESGETGLTQFFTSTALEEDIPATGDDAAHNQMDQLRQYGGQPLGISTDPSRSPPLFMELENDLEAKYPETTFSDTNESPVRRRILKRRKNVPEKSEKVQELNSEEFLKSRKEFIEEQAEESEDEYAAWRSGDESENENMDGVVEGLIDDDTKINQKAAEREVAKLYMEGELERDEKVVQGLMNDLQNGGLRRRRGGALDMGEWSDDDDDDDAEERRRRWELRREEMKRRMLEDENLGKLAANPKAQAFLNAISSTTLNFDDEPDFLGGDVIEDTKAGTAARVLPNSVPMGESQSQSQSQNTDTQMSAEIQVPATNSGDLPRHERDRLIIEELTQIEDSQPLLLDDISLSEASDSELDDTPSQSFSMDKIYTGFIDRAAQKRAARTASETTTRYAFKAVTAPSPARLKRSAVTVIEADNDSSRKKIMKEVVGSTRVKRKAWGTTKGRGAVTFRGSSGNKENIGKDVKKKGDEGAERRRRDMLMLMDSQNSFC